jgi:AraC-like DNA-binding protein
MCAAGRGLAAAHAAGVVHRDFKPDNVLVDDDGRVRVTDFGLAQLAAVTAPPAGGTAEAAPGGAPALALTALTASGALVGTPAYMAPEQLRGAPADERSDLFSFCVVFWEALYGERPFAGRDLDELRAAVCAGTVRSPPERRSVPRTLHDAIRRGLQPAPADRPTSITDLLEAVDAAAASTPLRAHAPRRQAVLGEATLTMSVFAVRAVALGAAMHGLPPDELCARFGFDPERLADIDARVPVSDMVKLWNEVPRLVGDDDEAALVHDTHGGISMPPRHFTEFGMAYLLLVARRVTGAAIVPRRLALGHPAPQNLDEHLRVYGVRPSFGVEVLQLVLARADLDRASIKADAVLAEVLDSHAREQLARLPTAPELIEQVRFAVVHALASGELSIPAVARRLGISPRTLRRRLTDDHGTSFRAVVDELRADVARQWVREGTRAVAEVAFSLGFADERAFHHAFVRWTDMTPEQFRRRSRS